MKLALPITTALCAVLLAACGGDHSPAPREAAPTVTAPGSAAPSSPAASSPAPSSRPTGCPPTGSGMPPGAVSKQSSLDVDGDGRPDTLWVSSSTTERRVGITTASGATFDTAGNGASPISPSAMLVDPTGNGAPLDVLYASREVQVFTVSGCALKPVIGSDGRPYMFGMGWTDTGTGMGCSTVAGHKGLVGLDAKQNGDGSWTITRTAVLQDGTRASNGPSDTVKAATGSAALASAQGQVACGDLTLAADGVSVLNE